ncbi:hypothetical protein FXO38_13541 [Capsicum annuum]|nr:hypothetical protein FXO38_13541 [Capsicum annuum]
MANLTMVISYLSNLDLKFLMEHFTINTNKLRHVLPDYLDKLVTELHLPIQVWGTRGGRRETLISQNLVDTTSSLLNSIPCSNLFVCVEERNSQRRLLNLGTIYLLKKKRGWRPMRRCWTGVRVAGRSGGVLDKGGWREMGGGARRGDEGKGGCWTG